MRSCTIANPQSKPASRGSPSAPIATARCAITDQSEFNNPNVVKVVVNSAGDALYFSRSPIPYQQNEVTLSDNVFGFKHIGLYAYRRPILLELGKLSPTALERTEQLEQLRALQYGYRITTVETDDNPIGVDTAEDLDKVRRLVLTGVTE